MKTRIFYIFLLIPSMIFSQGLQLGFGGGLSVYSKNLDYQFGPTILADYTFNTIPIFIRINGGYYLSYLNKENDISWDPTNNLVRLGITAGYIYRGIKNQPYIGFRCNYDINSIHSSANPARYFNGALHGYGNVEDNLSYEILAGMKFFAKSKTIVFFEISRIFSRPEYDQRSFNMTTNESSMKRTNFNFDSFQLKFGLLFAL